MENMKFRTIGERLNYEREPEVWENDTWDYINFGVYNYGLYENLSYLELIEE